MPPPTSTPSIPIPIPVIPIYELRLALFNRNITKRTLAREAGVTPEHLGRVLGGATAGKLITIGLWKACRRLEIDLPGFTDADPLSWF